MHLQPAFAMETVRPPKNPKDMFKEDSQAAITSLLMVLSCGDNDDQRTALGSLELFAENTYTLIEVLIETLEERTTNEIKIAAIRAVEKLGRLAFQAIPSLVCLLDDKSWKIREAALEALVPMGRLAKSASPYVAQIAQSDKYPVLRDKATHTLNSIN